MWATSGQPLKYRSISRKPRLARLCRVAPELIHSALHSLCGQSLRGAGAARDVLRHKAGLSRIESAPEADCRMGGTCATLDGGYATRDGAHPILRKYQGTYPYVSALQELREVRLATLGEGTQRLVGFRRMQALEEELPFLAHNPAQLVDIRRLEQPLAQRHRRRR